MASREIWSLAGTFSTWVKGFVILLILSVCASSLQAREYEAEQQRLDKFFPGASLSAAEGDYQVRTITKGDEVLGYAFQSINVVDIPAYSGKPINMQVLLDPQGRSEEHTSELQSLMRTSYAVLCLKKKNNNTIFKNTSNQHQSEKNYKLQYIRTHII